MSKTYSISELASEFDITTRAIRFYEDKNLLSPSRQGQTRIYAAADRTKLKLILRGKRLGISLEDSGEIINMYSPGENNANQLKRLLAKIGERRDALNQQLIDIQALMLDLDEAEQGCIKALETTTNR